MTTSNPVNASIAATAEPKIVGSGDASTSSRVVASKLAEEVRAKVERTGCPAYDEGYKAALERQAESEIAAATPPPIDPEKSLIDKWVLAMVDKLYTEIEEGKEQIVDFVKRRNEWREKLAALIPPLSLRWRIAMAGLTTIVTGLAIAAVGYLLAPSVDTFLLRSYVEGLYPNGAELYSAAVALRSSLLYTCALLVAHLIAFLITWGRLGRYLKFGLLAVDLVFSGAFCMLRLGGDFAWAAVAVSAFELSILLAHDLVLVALASRLATDTDRREAFIPVAQATALAERLVVDEVQQVEKLEAELRQQLLALDTRETAVRQEGRNRELVKATAGSEYLSTLAKLVAEATDTKAERELSEMNENQLNDGFARYRAGLSRRADA